MKIKYLVLALFSLGLVCTSCGKKKKGDHQEETATEQQVPVEDHHDHGHEGHEGHDH